MKLKASDFAMKMIPHDSTLSLKPQSLKSDLGTVKNGRGSKIYGGFTPLRRETNLYRLIYEDKSSLFN